MVAVLIADPIVLLYYLPNAQAQELLNNESIFKKASY